MIALVDYGAGNLTSVRKALAAIGADVWTPSVPGELGRAHGIIVPGVGHFDATRALTGEWRAAIRSMVADGVPLLGICVGMQWLFEGSAEAPPTSGLCVFEGRCFKLGSSQPHDLKASKPLKVPHVGWNALSLPRPSGLMQGVMEGSQVYFTHSFAAPVTDDAAAITEYGTPFSAAVERGNVSGVQFHPEKSGDVGLRILSNWLGMSRRSSGGAPADSSRRSSEGAPADSSRRSSEGAPADSSAEAPKERRRMLSKRIIACLDVRDGKVVKGINFEGLRDAGDPAALARRYNVEGIDEVVILDVTATIESRQARAHTIAAVAKEIFLPLTVGGGIRGEEDAAAAIEAGADKVSLNTAALDHPDLITTLAKRYGSQAVIVAIDAKSIRLKADAPSDRRHPRYEVFARSGRASAHSDAVAWAREASDRGAGEILLTSIDRDGTKAGFDCELTAAVSDAVSIPVIASGGAGTFEHFAEVFDRGHADAALAASIFHFNEQSVRDLKQFLSQRQIPVRL